MLQQNMGYLEYTYLHRKAFAYVVEELIKDPADKEEMLKRARFHDLDKSLLYTLIPKSEASRIHRNTSSHHMGNDGEKTRYDYMEAILDYECAALTKPDKPRNAYDTVKELRPNHEKELTEIMESLRINYSYKRTPDDKFKAYIEKNMPTEERILSEIFQYIRENPESSYYISVADKWYKAIN